MAAVNQGHKGDEATSPTIFAQAAPNTGRLMQGLPARDRDKVDVCWNLKPFRQLLEGRGQRIDLNVCVTE